MQNQYPNGNRPDWNDESGYIPPSQQPRNPQTPKKKKKGALTLVIAIVALLLVAVSLTAVLVLRTLNELEDYRESRYEEREDEDDEEEEEEEEKERPALREEYEDAPAVKVPAVESDNLNVFMSAAYYTAPYASPLMEGAAQKCAELGWELVTVDGEVNAEKQLTQFKNAVADGYDAFIYWPADPSSAIQVVEYLNSTGLPWVIVNTLPTPELYDQCTMISYDEYDIGSVMGEMILDYYKEHGSKPLNIAYIEGNPDTTYTVNVTAGLQDALARYSDIQILNEPVYSNFDPAQAMIIMEDMIVRFGDEIDLVVTQDGGMLQGAYNAIQAAGMVGEYGLICQGQDLFVRELLLSGQLYATASQDPFTEGFLAVDVLYRLVIGEIGSGWHVPSCEPIYAYNTDAFAWF